MKRTKLGFTLIELLVVIAIIGILAAILFPVITAAIMKAKTVECVSNLKQQVTGLMTYTQSNNLRLPGSGSPTRSGTWNSPTPYNYGGAVSGTKRLDSGRPLNRNIPDVELYECPLDAGGSSLSNLAYDSNGTSYGYVWDDVNGLEKLRNGSKGKFLSDPSLVFSSKKAVFFDYCFRSYTLNAPSPSDAWHNKKNAGGVLGFLDGHAAFTEFESGHSSAPSSESQREIRVYY